MFAKHSAITFDVGRSCVRACQLRAQRGRAELRDKLRFELPTSPPAAPGSPDPPRGKAPPAGAASVDCERIARLVGQGSFVGGDVGLVLSPPDVRFHAAKLAESVLRQPEERVRAAVAFEAAREARCEPGELEVRWWRLPPGNQQGLNVMTMGLTTKRTLEWFAAFQTHKLALRRIDAAPCALMRAACESWTPGERDMWAVLDLGFRQSILTVVIGRTVAYVRALTTAADSWTRCLAQAFESEYGEAEALKRRHGISLPDSADPLARETDEQNMPRAIFELLREQLDALVREVDLCCSYVVQSYSDVEMRRLILTGGGAELRGLSEFIALHLGVPIQRLGGEVDDGLSHVGRGGVHLVSPALLGVECGADFAAALGSAMLDLEAA
jgi:hypothetical protein